MTNIYLAGHLHDNWRGKLIDEIERQIPGKIGWLLPRRNWEENHGKPGNDPRFYVARDIQLVNRAHVVANYIAPGHGNIGGTWESGYAFAKHIPVLMYDEDVGNYRYDIIRATAIAVYPKWDEWVQAIIMVGMDG